MKNPPVSLKPDEEVRFVFRRSPIMTVLIIFGEVLATILFIALLIYLSTSNSFYNNMLIISDPLSHNMLYLVTGVLYVVLLLAGLISLRIHYANILYVTNLRLIHTSTTTLFAQSINIINLKNVEDVSFKQSTIFEHVFHLGQLRLSTVGDETTYTFPYLDTPSAETLSQLSQLISSIT